MYFFHVRTYIILYYTIYVYEKCCILSLVLLHRLMILVVVMPQLCLYIIFEFKYVYIHNIMRKISYSTGIGETLEGRCNEVDVMLKESTQNIFKIQNCHFILIIFFVFCFCFLVLILMVRLVLTYTLYIYIMQS